MSPLTIAFLGPLGTFSHEVATKIFGDQITALPQSTFFDIFSAVAEGKADQAVVPIENSTQGAIQDTLECLHSFEKLTICGEFNFTIHHHLLGHTDLKTATHLATFSKPLAQCRRWHQEHAHHLDIVPTSSSAQAAQLAATDPGTIAISSELAASLYNLPIIERSIQDRDHNQTRFFVICPQKCQKQNSGPMKTSIWISLLDSPGALMNTLKIFNDAQINLTFIESHPGYAEHPSYCFFIDFEGDSTDPAIATALEEVKKCTDDFKLFGSYPQLNR